MGAFPPTDTITRSETGVAPRATFPITARAVVVGGACVSLLAIINPELAFVSRTWNTGVGSLLQSAIFVLFMLVALNGVLLRRAPRLAFSRGELLVIYGMLIVSVGFTIWGGMPFILSGINYPFYFDTPSYDWEHRIFQYIPTWLRPTTNAAIIDYWEGNPGAGVPYAALIMPLLAWSSFTLALMVAMFCLGSLLRRDWIERQRLAFPLVDVPLAITGDREHPTLRASFLSSPIFWIGFAIPASLSLLGWINRLVPSVPAPNLWAIPVGSYFSSMGLPWNVLSDVRVTIIFPIIGVSCLIPSEVALSLWFFYLLFNVQMLVWASFGVAEGTASSVNINPRLFAGFEEAGAFFALIGLILFQSRHTLRAAWLELIGRARPDPDPYSPLSGRGAILGFLGANLFLFAWVFKFGASLWAFAAMLVVYYVILIGASRLVSAAGVMSTDTGFYPRWILGRTLGAAPLGEPALVFFAYFTSMFTFEPDNLAMPQMLQSFKLLHAGKVRARWFPLAASLAMVLLLATGIPALLNVLYYHGANNLGTWPFVADSRWGFNEMNNGLRFPEAPDNWLRFALLLGAGVMLGLTWLHTRFLWWPIHPLGFLIGSSWGNNYKLWTNALIAWLLTTLIRRYGGLSLYRALRPAFLGLILGQYLTDGILAILSAVFGLNRPLT